MGFSTRARATRVPRSGALAAILIVAAASAMLLWPLPNAYRALCYSRLLDLLHLPLLAGVTFALYAALGGRTGLACATSAALAAGCELAQAAVGRSPDWADIARSLLGVTMAGSLLWAASPPRSALRWVLGCSAAGLIAGGSAWQYGPVAADSVLAYAAFPVLADFGSPWEPDRWYAQSARLRRIRSVTAMSGWEGQVECSPAADGPCGLILFPIVRDWSGYRRLRCDLSCHDQAQRLLISLRDGRKVRPPQRRFDLRTQLQPGRHCIDLDLTKLAGGSEFAPIDLRRVQSFHLGLDGATPASRLTIHRIWIE